MSSFVKKRMSSPLPSLNVIECPLICPPDKIPAWDQICPFLIGCIFSHLLSASSRRLLFLCPKLVGPSSVLLQRCQIISSEVSLQRYPSSLGYTRIFLLPATTKTDVLLAVQQQQMLPPVINHHATLILEWQLGWCMCI